MANITISDLAPVETEFAELSAREVTSVVGGFYYYPYYYGGYTSIRNYSYDYTTQVVSVDNFGLVGTLAIVAS